MTKIKTDKEHMIDVRNKISRTIVENRANILYWQEVARKAEKNTDIEVDAKDKIKINRVAIKKDKLFLKLIDKKLSKMK